MGLPTPSPPDHERESLDEGGAPEEDDLGQRYAVLPSMEEDHSNVEVASRESSDVGNLGLDSANQEGDLREPEDVKSGDVSAGRLAGAHGRDEGREVPAAEPSESAAEPSLPSTADAGRTGMRP